MALSVCAATQSLAQAPSSVAGMAFTGTVTNGTSPFASVGAFMLLPATSGSNYDFLGICGMGDENGLYGYSPSGELGQATLSFMGQSASVSFDFLTPSSGIFSQNSGSNIQSGEFFMLSGQAPLSLAGVSLSLAPEHAALPFAASNGLFKAAAQGNSYTLSTPVGEGSQQSTGTYSYSVVNRSTGAVRINDSVAGPVEMYLAFGDSFSGAYALRQPTFGGYQVGSFRLWALTNSWNLWWQHTDGTMAVWQMSGTNAALETRLNPAGAGNGWHMMGSADFNGDGQEDLLFENTNGAVAVWLMNCTNRQNSAYLTPSRVDPKWQVACTGDFNGDGQPDIIWENVDGALAVWLMNGLVSTQSLRLNPAVADIGWHIVGSGDFNNDHQTDLLWENSAGRLAVWLMHGANRVSVVYLNPPQVNSTWKVAGTKDFNGDGHPGIIWRQDSGALSVWQLEGVNCAFSSKLNPGSTDTSWKIVGPK